MKKDVKMPKGKASGGEQPLKSIGDIGPNCGKNPNRKSVGKGHSIGGRSA